MTTNGECHAFSAESYLSLEVFALRKAFFDHIPNRDHAPLQFYTHGSDQYDLVVHGEVMYNHHHGHETGGDWAAVIKLVKEGEEIKMKNYHIITVSLETQNFRNVPIKSP